MCYALLRLAAFALLLAAAVPLPADMSDNLPHRPEIDTNGLAESQVANVWRAFDRERKRLVSEQLLLMSFNLPCIFSLSKIFSCLPPTASCLPHSRKSAMCLFAFE
jgi:hypothetical protein